MPSKHVFDLSDLCVECGEFLEDGHMTNCSSWRLGQSLSWREAVLTVLRESKTPLSPDQILNEIRLQGHRVFRVNSVSASSALRRALTGLTKTGIIELGQRTGRFLVASV